MMQLAFVVAPNLKRYAVFCAFKPNKKQGDAQKQIQSGKVSDRGCQNGCLSILTLSMASLSARNLDFRKNNRSFSRQDVSHV